MQWVFWNEYLKAVNELRSSNGLISELVVPHVCFSLRRGGGFLVFNCHYLILHTT